MSRFSVVRVMELVSARMDFRTIVTNKREPIGLNTGPRFGAKYLESTIRFSDTSKFNFFRDSPRVFVKCFSNKDTRTIGSKRMLNKESIFRRKMRRTERIHIKPPKTEEKQQYVNIS